MDRRAYSPWGNKESDTTKRLSTGHIGIIRLIFSHLKFIKSSVHSSEMEPSSHSWGESLVNHNVYHHPCHHHPCILCISILQHFIQYFSSIFMNTMPYFLILCCQETKSESVSHSLMSDSLWLHRLYIDFLAPLSMEFSRQEYWSEQPFPSPGVSDGKESAYDAGDPRSIPQFRRSPREGNSYPLQYSCLQNSMNTGTWWPQYKIYLQIFFSSSEPGEGSHVKGKTWEFWLQL